MTNEGKKRFLQSYQDSVKRLELISAEIDEIRAMKMGLSREHRAAFKNDLSGCLAELDELERKLQKEQRGISQILKDVLKAVDSLEDLQKRSVLFYRYIKGLAWGEIAEKMHYSEAYICRIHSGALLHLELPQNGRP